MTLPPSIPIIFLILGALAIGASDLARLRRPTLVMVITSLLALGALFTVRSETPVTQIIAAWQPVSVFTVPFELPRRFNGVDSGDGPAGGVERDRLHLGSLSRTEAARPARDCVAVNRGRPRGSLRQQLIDAGGGLGVCSIWPLWWRCSSAADQKWDGARLWPSWST